MNQTPSDPHSNPPPVLTPGAPRIAPQEQEPHDEITGITSLIEAILRRPQSVAHQIRHGNPGSLIGRLIAVAIVFAAIYGLIVGSFSGGVQWWASPAKVAGGLMITAVICLPSLYIFACLCGSTARLHEVAGTLGGLLALLTLLLIGFSPVAWLFSQSTESVAMMGFLHLLFWAVAAGFGIRFLRSTFRQFGLRSESGLNTWVIIFLLVSLQMTSALRPILGTSPRLLPQEKKFFAAHWMDCMNTDSSRRER